MRAGKLDRTIIIQSLIEASPDEYGSPQLTWAAVTTLRAEIIETSTRESVRDYGVATDIGITFRTRYVSGITTADRIAYAGRVYDLKDVREIGRRRGLELRTVGNGTAE